MSAVIPGAGEIGNNEQAWVNKIMKDPENAKVVMYYGISALVLAFVNLIIYLVANNRNWLIGTASKWWFWIHELIWWPVGIFWIALAFYDAKWLRTLFSGLIQWSFLGPFAGFWVAIVYFMVKVDEHVLSNGKKGWAYWGVWVVLPLYIGYTIFAMIIQVGMVPKIFDWIDNAPIDENLPKEKDENTEAVADSADDAAPAADFSANTFDF